MIKDMPLTIGYRDDSVVGRITLNEEVERFLAEGHTLRLIPAIRRDENGNQQVVELCLLSALEPVKEKTKDDPN